MTYQFAEINGTQLHYQIIGTGESLILIHAGIAHLGMWDEQAEAFAPYFQVIRYDVRGWGQSTSPAGPFAHFDDLRGLLDYLQIDQAVILGISHGGKIAIDFALAYPKMVSRLVLVAPALGGYEFVDEATNQQDVAIEEAYERGDIPTCIELEAKLWVDGPYRSPDQVDPGVRSKMLDMINNTLHLPDGEGDQQQLDPSAIDRLDEIKVPAQVIIGDLDVPDMLIIADLLAANIAGAKKVVIPGVAHMINLEKSEGFNHIVLDFLNSIPEM